MLPESVGDVAEYWGPGSFVTEMAVPGLVSFVWTKPGAPSAAAECSLQDLQYVHVTFGPFHSFFPGKLDHNHLKHHILPALKMVNSSS